MEEIAEVVAPIVTTATKTPTLALCVASAAVGYLTGTGVVYLIKRKKNKTVNVQKIED